MGYKSVDGRSDQLDGFKWLNQTEDEEFVTLGCDTVEISAGVDIVNIWVDDIPKLIKALKAAYKTYPTPMKED